jgi:outer membrane protein assembly factor BamB
MNYPDYYLKACQIMECEPDDSFEAKKAAFHRVLEQWQQEYQGYKHDRGGQPELSEQKLEELKWAVAVIYEFEGSLEPRPQPSNWRDRFWQNLPVGQLIPEFSFAEELDTWVTPVISNGIMYAGYRDFSIGAIDIAAKEEIWRFAANGRTTSPVVHQGIVFFGSTDRHAYAVDAGSGEEIWRFRAIAQIHLPPAVSEKSVYFSIGHQQIHCFDFTTGRKKWNSQTKSKVVQRPFLLDDSVLLFVQGLSLHCFHAETGALQWTIRSKHLSPDHKCGQLKSIVVMDLSLWRPLRLPHDSGSEGNGWSIPDWDLDDRDPVTGEETHTMLDAYKPSSLVAFHGITGRVVWMLPMPGRVDNLFCSDGMVYGLCAQPHRQDIFAIDGETGQQLWMIHLEQQEKYGRFFAGDGKTYYIDLASNVYEIITA